MAAHPKRKLDETDPDYETLENQQAKHQRALEEDGRQNARRKVQAIIHREFQAEISNKEREFQQVDMRLNEARLMLDRLRACIVANYYGLAGTSAQSQQASEAQSIHPAVKSFIGKAPKNHPRPAEGEDLTDANAQSLSDDIKEKECWDKQMAQKSIMENSYSSLLHENAMPVTRVDSPSLNMSSQNQTFDDRRARLKIKRNIIVGNVSKYIPVDQREPNDMSSHKWMIYVRGPKSDPDIGHFVKRVWFFLHHSYKPNDLVEISKPPFHLTRRGWGEFPVRVQLHFLDPRNKKVDIFHHLKLDKTFTGLQKLGGETVVEVELERDSFEETQAPCDKSVSSASKSSLSSISSLSSQDEQVISANKTCLSVSGNHLDSNCSKSQDMLSVKDIKIETISPAEELQHECSDARTNSKTKNLNCEFSSGEVQPIETHKKHWDDDDKFLKEGDQNLNLDICAINASIPNSIANSEYNVMIDHRSHDEQSCQDDQVVDVCGGGEITVKHESVEENQSPSQPEQTEEDTESINPAQSGKFKQVEKLPCQSVPTQCAVSANVHPKLVHNLMSHIPSKKSPIPVTLISAKEASHWSPKSSSQTVHEHSSKSSNLKNTSESEHYKQQKSAATSVPLSISPLSQPQASQNVSTPLQAHLSNHPNNLNSQHKASSVNACSGNIQNSLCPSGILPLTSNNIQQFKVINFKKGKKANPSTPTMVLKTMPNATTAKIISSVGTVTSILNPVHKDSSSTSPADKKTLQPVSLLQNEDFKKRALVVHVQPNTAPAKFLLKPDTKFVPSVPKVSLLGPHSHKKQVSLLTGMVIDAPKAFHSSNAKSLLRPEMCKLVENSKNHDTSQAGIASDKTKDMFQGAGKKILINSIPLNNNNRQITKTLKVSEDIILVPSRAFTPGQTLVSNSHLKKSTSPQEISHNPASLNFPMLYERKSAIGITKHKYLDMYHQAIGKGKKAVNKSDLIEGTVEIIPHLRLEDFPNIHCLVKAAVKLHPLIQANVNKLTHPYCAVSREQWESWPVGKQRAAEWHRACFVIKYLKLCLNGEAQYKGEKLMSKRQLVHWCRLHAFSPQPAIFHKRSEEDELLSTVDQGETNIAISNSILGLKSTTKLKEVESLLQTMENSIEDQERSEDVDVIADEKSTATTVKNERLLPDTSQRGTKVTPIDSEGAKFVREWMRQRGIRFSPNQIERDVLAYTAPNMIFEAMLEFGADIIRKAYCVNAEQCSSTGKLSIKDVHNGLMALPEASFCSNRFLGKEEEEESDDRFKHEKEIYR